MMFLVLALHVTLGAPQPIAEIDMAKLKGEVARLAWSADASDFYVQTVDRDRAGHVIAVRHYVVSAATRNVKSIDQEPPWAAAYWSWKSAQSAPGMNAFRIEVEQHEETFRATAAPTGGALAKGQLPDANSGTTFQEVADAANQTQKALVSTLKVRDETIGTWMNEPVIPGFTFAWAPAPLHLLAFARRDKKDGGPIVVVDSTGQMQELAGPKSAILPAWSDDGKRLAWLERKDKKKFVLMVADVSTP